MNYQTSLPSCLLCLLIGAMTFKLSAATSNWVGGTGTNWNTAANWDVLPVPATDMDLVFGTATNLAATNDFTAASNFGGITFGAGAGAFTLSGNSITLNGSIINNSSVTQIISLAQVLAAGAHTVNAATGNITISGGMSGTGSVSKAGAGTLTFSAQQTYTGGTVIDAGILDLTGGGGGAGVIRGTATVNTGGTLRWSTGDASGFGGGANALTTVNLTGGTLNVNTTANQTLGSATINMTGGSITGVAGSNLDFFGGASALNTLASATTSTISGTTLRLRQNNGLTVNVADGAAATDLQIDSQINIQTGFTSNNLTKTGAGTLLLNNVNNSWTTNLVVSAGKVTTGTTTGAGTNGYLGAVNGTRTISIASGASIDLNANNVFGGAGKTAASIPQMSISGTLNSTKFNIIGTTTLSGGTLAQSSTNAGAYQGYQFLGDVTVSGAVASTISTGNGKANHLRGGATHTFTVNDVTASTAVDLTMSAPLADGSGDYTGVGALIKAGAGTMTMSAASSYTGGTTVDAGTLTMSGSAGFGGNNGSVGSGPLTINTGATATGTVAFSISGDTSAANSRVVHVSGGTLNLGATEYVKTYNLTGGTINAPTAGAEYLRASAAGLFFNSLSSATTSTVANKVDLTFGNLTVDVANGTAATDLNISGVISQNQGAGSGAKTLTKTGDGTLSLSGTAANTYTGLTTISAGTLSINKNDGITALAGDVLVNGTGALTSDAARSNRIADTANVTIDGSSASFQIGGNQSEAINTLAVNNGGSVNIGDTGSNLRPNGGVTSTGGGTISGSAGHAGLNLGGGTRTIDVADSTLAVSATIYNGSLTKTGAGNMMVSAANTYAGGTTVSTGTMEVNNTSGSGTGTGTVTVNNAATLKGTGSIAAASGSFVYINGTLHVGNTGATAGTDFALATSGAGSTVFGGSSTLGLDLWSTTGADMTGNQAAADTLRLFGTLDITSGATLLFTNPNALTFQAGDVFRVFDWSSLTTRNGTFTTDFSNITLSSGLGIDSSDLYTLGTISIIGVPEPSRAVLGMMGLAGLLARRRRNGPGLHAASN